MASLGIHGDGIKRWTAFIAVANEAIEELWQLCLMGTPVRIKKDSTGISLCR